jgi:hypothetical protein
VARVSLFVDVGPIILPEYLEVAWVSISLKDPSPRVMVAKGKIGCSSTTSIEVKNVWIFIYMDS